MSNPIKLDVIPLIVYMNNIAVALDGARSMSHNRQFEDSFILGALVANIENILVDFKTLIVQINPALESYLPGIGLKMVTVHKKDVKSEEIKDSDKEKMVI